MDYVNMSVRASMGQINRLVVGSIHFLNNGYVFSAKSVTGETVYPMISYGDIVDVKVGSSIGIIENTMTISLVDGKKQEFRIKEPRKVSEYIRLRIRTGDDVNG